MTRSINSQYFFFLYQIDVMFRQKEESSKIKVPRDVRTSRELYEDGYILPLVLPCFVTLILSFVFDFPIL